MLPLRKPDDHDIVLPWQFVLWGFMVFLVLFALLMVAISFDPSLQKHADLLRAIGGFVVVP